MGNVESESALLVDSDRGDDWRLSLHERDGECMLQHTRAKRKRWRGVGSLHPSLYAFTAKQMQRWAALMEAHNAVDIVEYEDDDPDR